MTRCKHCKKLTHSEHLYVVFQKEDIDKVYEFMSLENWTPAYQYTDNLPKKYGMLKIVDIYIHFLFQE